MVYLLFSLHYQIYVEYSSYACREEIIPGVGAPRGCRNYQVEATTILNAEKDLNTKISFVSFLFPFLFFPGFSQEFYDYSAVLHKLFLMKTQLYTMCDFW